MSAIVPISADARADSFRRRIGQLLYQFGLNDTQIETMLSDIEREVAEYQDGGYPPMCAIVSSLITAAMCGRCAEMTTDKFREITSFVLPQAWDAAAYGVDHADNHLEDQKNGFKMKVEH